MHRKGKKRQFEKEVANKYIIERMLGEGGFCVVFKAVDKTTKHTVAVKRMDKSKPLYKKFQNPKAMEKLNKLMYREADVMRQLQHDNIMKLVDFIDDGHHIYLVLEFAEGGELHNKLMQVGRFKESVVSTIIRQVVAGLNFMHQAGYIHRDIKAENILFRSRNSAHIIITDFGLSRECEDMLHTNCGTLVYSSPELLRNKETKKGYDKTVDNWATGVLTYLLLCGYLPFDDATHKEQKIVAKIMRAKPNFPYAQWHNASPESKKFIMRFLDPNPTSRMSMTEAENHNFVVSMKEKMSRMESNASIMLRKTSSAGVAAITSQATTDNSIALSGPKGMKKANDLESVSTFRPAAQDSEGGWSSYCCYWVQNPAMMCYTTVNGR